MNRIIEPDDQSFIEALVADNHQEVYWKGWVSLYTKKNAASRKDRIVVITNFRLMTIKLGVLKRSMRQSFPFLDLESIEATEGSNELHLQFSNNKEKEPLQMTIISPQVPEIVQSLVFGYRSVTYGLPDEQMPRVDVPDSFMERFLPPSPDTQDGILAHYLAMCDYVGIPPRLPVLDYFMGSFETNEKDFDMVDCLGDKATGSDILTIASALRFSNWFDELVAIDAPIKDEGLAHIATIFGNSSFLRKCVLVNVKASGKGFQALAEQIALGNHGLESLNISKNNVGDAGIKALLEALIASNKVLGTLCVANCGFSAKGFKSLFENLSQPLWLTGLKVLDVSDNVSSKPGQEAMCDWLKEADALQQLYCMRCSLDLEMFFQSLSSNDNGLGLHMLQTLNISGNKVTKQAVPLLCSILTNTTTLSHVYLVGCSLSKSGTVEIVKAAIENQNGVRFWLELTDNGLGEKGAHQLAELLEHYPKIATIHTLILNNNGLGADGIAAIVSQLKGKAIHTLSIDNNMKSGMFGSKAKEACEAIALFMNATPSLCELSISGDDSHYLKQAAYVVFDALRENKTLKHLDVSRNRLGDEGIRLLSDALKVNRTLVSFTAERNRITIQGLRYLHEAVMQNETLVDWAIPMHDIEISYKTSTNKVAEELKSMVYDFEQAMDRNWAASQDDGKAEAEDSVSALVPPDTQVRRISQYSRRKNKRHSRVASDMFASFDKDVMLELKAKARFSDSSDEEEAS